MKYDYYHKKTTRIKLNRLLSPKNYKNKTEQTGKWREEYIWITFWCETQIFIGSNREEIGATITDWFIISLLSGVLRNKRSDWSLKA